MHRMHAWQQAFYQIGLAVVGLFVAIPLWMMFQMAFDKAIIGYPIDFRVIPRQFSLQIFAGVWQRVGQTLTFPGALANSLFVSGLSAGLAVLLGASMAYAFARYRFVGRRIGLVGLMVGALLPPVALMTPLYILLTILKLRTSLWGLVIVYTAFSMPFCVWNMRAAFQTISSELEEAAHLDGAGPLTAFLRVSLPIALPSIAIGGLLAFLAGYTEFAMAWLFVDRSTNVTLAMAISGMVGQSGVSWSSLAALSLLMSLPVVIIFLLLQRTILNSLLIGAPGET